MQTCATAMLLLLSISGSAFAQPTMEEIRREFDAGHYGPAVSLISRALSVRGAEAKELDRYELLFLRGESFLQLRQTQYALRAFEEAFYAADDPKKKAAAIAVAALIRRSPGFTYTPIGSPEQRFNILDKESRKHAMAALYGDMRDHLRPSVAEAVKANTLVPIRNLLPQLAEVASMEMVLSGDTKESKELYEQLGGRARELLNAELHEKRRFLEEANGQLYGLEISSTGNLRPRSLGTYERKELEDLRSYITRLRSCAIRGRKIAQVLGEGTSQWEPLIANADDLEDRVEVILAQGQ